MYKTLPLLLVILVAACESPRPIEERDQLSLDTACVKTQREFLARDPSLKEWFESKAQGYALFPSVGKGGFVVGGAWGRGQVYEQGSRVGYATISQGTVGLQAGVQEYAEVIFFKDAPALKEFQLGNFEVSAQVSAIAATAGASADAEYNHGVAIFTLGKGGLMAEASVGGQKFAYEPDVTK